MKSSLFKRFRPIHFSNTLQPSKLHNISVDISRRSKDFTRSIKTSAISNYISKNGNGARLVVGHWLIATSGLVFGIVVLGGLTRLTESGLSMVDWRFMHFKPPSSEKEWIAYFEKYKQFPEYKLKGGDNNMDLEDFKRIYWFEHAHRVYGRLLGLFIAIPSAFFIIRKWANPKIRWALLGCTSLVAFQGLLGWYMVKSGLRNEMIENKEQPRVSQYRLAAHLGTAFILYLSTLSLGLHIVSNSRNLASKPAMVASLSSLRFLRSSVVGMSILTFFTAISGALVAGLDAGLIYNSFPLMGNHFVPSDVWDEKLGYFNATENPSMVQFIHRLMAYSTLTGITVLWLFSKSRPLPPSIRKTVSVTSAVAWIQASLGVSTLLSSVSIPLASLHQAGSMGLLGSLVVLLSKLKGLQTNSKDL